MEPMRVLLLEVPRLLREVLEHAIHQDGAFQVMSAADAVAASRETIRPDMVILGLTADEDSTLVPALFARWPGAPILTVMQQGQTAALYELRRHRQALGEVSPAEMLRTLRDAAQRHAHDATSNGRNDDARRL